MKTLYINDSSQLNECEDSNVALNPSQNWHIRRVSESEEIVKKGIDEKIRGFVVRSREHRCLELTSGQKVIDFMSCSYLGLETDSRLIRAAGLRLGQWGTQMAAARTRMLPECFEELDHLLQNIFCNRPVVVFQNLHSAHQGILPLLSIGKLPSFPLKKRGPVFLIERTVHASIHVNKPVLQQFGPVITVDQTNISNIVNQFEQAFLNDQTPILLADSVGSMGRVAQVGEFSNIANQFEGYVYIDDAHGTSVYGEHGEGYVLSQLPSGELNRFIICASLAKAFGAPGGGVVCLPSVADSLFVRRHASTYIFGGPPAIPLIEIAIASAHIHLSPELSVIQKKLWSNINLFDQHFVSKCSINFGIQSPIRGFEFNSAEKGLLVAKDLFARGYVGTFATYPTISKGKSLIRLALSASHEPEQILGLLDACQKWLVKDGSK